MDWADNGRGGLGKEMIVARVLSLILLEKLSVYSVSGFLKT